MPTVQELIKAPRSKVFRELFIKRRSTTTGQFESDWQKITEDVKKWGNVTVSTTPERPGDIKFSPMKFTLANDEGKYNPHTDVNSLWFGYAQLQRSLVKVEFGFIKETFQNGAWKRRKVPSQKDGWDVSRWDEDEWDDGEIDIEYLGIVNGDIDLSDKNNVVLNVSPLTQVFRDYPASRLDGYTSTGMTAQEFFESARDHQDGGGNYLFRPFFGDTMTGWSIASTTINYDNLNSPNAVDVIDASVWDVMTKLSVAENFVPYVDQAGVFNFKNRAVTGTSEFDFFGAGFFSDSFGHTIKSVDRFGPRISALFTRVQVKFNEEDTATSYVTSDADISISGSNLPWIFGYRDFKLDNTYIPDTATAQTLADNLRTEFSSLKNEILFTTSFVPQLSVLDPISISYTTEIREDDTIWGANTWTNQLKWKKTGGDAIDLNAAEYFLTKIVINLDKFECKFTAREQ